MAKRKRLTPAQSGFLGAAPETKSALSPASLSPPIAQVAGEASATAALQELSDMVQDARAEGRLIRALSLDAVQVDYMLRDRLLAPEDEEMQALIDSLRTRGQQTPIDVVDLGNDRFGLVSGLRRLTAMRVLRRESAGLGFTQINARIISPQNGPDAYVSMVEENEIRAGLSFYERARIVVKAVEAGIFADQRDALLTLYGNTARAKRSKIKSFTSVVEALDNVLLYPSSLSERFGLELAKALSVDGVKAQITQALRAAPPESAEAELESLRLVLDGLKTDAPGEKLVVNTPEIHPKSADLQTKQTENMQKSSTSPNPISSEESGNGLFLEVLDNGRRLVVSGPSVSEDLRKDLVAWLASR